MSAAGGGGAKPSPERENLIQRNLRNKVCAYCKKPGAKNKCEACEQRTYCDKKCQKKDWKAVHREQCKKLQQVFVPPPAGWREAAAVAGGGGAAAAASAVGVEASVDGDGEEENLCPICLDNEDDAIVGGNGRGMCSACGQFYCGACRADGLADKSPNCPTCRAPFGISNEDQFKRLWKLVHDRSPGRHTPVAQSQLGAMYYNGKGVKQDYNEAFKWSTLAVEGGSVEGMGSLGVCYMMGNGVAQDASKGVYYMQRAAAKGLTQSIQQLAGLQQRNIIPTPPPGTHVTVILLTSAAAAAKYNNKKGVVVALPEGEPAVKVGRAAVLLEGEANPISFKLMNLRLGL